MDRDRLVARIVAAARAGHQRTARRRTRFALLIADVLAAAREVAALFEKEQRG